MAVISELIRTEENGKLSLEIIHWLQRQSLTILRRMEISIQRPLGEIT